jgi:hypothetical protein
MEDQTDNLKRLLGDAGGPLVTNVNEYLVSAYDCVKYYIIEDVSEMNHEGSK